MVRRLQLAVCILGILAGLAWVGLLATGAAAMTSHHVPAIVWKRLAICETGNNLRHYTLSYEGLYGFTHAAWDQFRPRWFPHGAHVATRKQQTAVAHRILVRVGPGAWPVCSYRAGLR